MHLLAELPYVCVSLIWDKPIAGRAETRVRQMRGAIAEAFEDNPWFHQHDEVGKPLYRYPHIQYRWRRGAGLVIGWRDAASQLLEAPWLDLDLRLGDELVCVDDAFLTSTQASFAVSEQLLHYRLASPVLLFNQQNYQRYQRMPESAQRIERDRLLVAQLLTALRGLDVTFSERLLATFSEIRTVVCHYKRQELLGIKGAFVCNAVLPGGFAFGHAVSHGFGWIAAEGDAGIDGLAIAED